MDGRVLAMDWRVKRGHVVCSNYLISSKYINWPWVAVDGRVLAVGGRVLVVDGRVYWQWVAVSWRVTIWLTVLDFPIFFSFWCVYKAGYKAEYKLV